jgi:BON domain
MDRRRFAIVLSLCASALTAHAQERRNYFNDPFAQVSSAIPNCPLPAGPFMTEQQRHEQSHHRAEKGTTCWLAGQCDRPNSFAYDADIFTGLKDALATSPLLAGTTLWVTVQGRVIFIEGCVTDEAVGMKLEALAASVPNVQQAISNVFVPAEPGAKPRYRLLTDP